METNLDKTQLLILGYFRDFFGSLDERYIMPKNMRHNIYIINKIYCYYTREQTFLLLLGGSEESKEVKYNQIQIIKMTNIFDIKNNLNATYEYNNYRLSLNNFKKTINYDKYYKNISERTPNLSRPRTPKTAYSDREDPLYSINIQNNKSRKTKKKSKNCKDKKGKKDKNGKSKGKKAVNGGNKTKNGKKKKKKSKDSNNPFKLLEAKDFDRYSFGSKMVSLGCDLPSWPWLTKKYNNDIYRNNVGEGDFYKNNDNNDDIDGNIKMDYDDDDIIDVNKFYNVSLEHQRYKMFIRCGGTKTRNDEVSDKNELILFNAANLNSIGRIIDSYIVELPKFKDPIEMPFIDYDNNNKIYSFGGNIYGEPIKQIYSLQLNKPLHKMSWKKCGYMMKPNYGCTAVNMERNKFILFGGKGRNNKNVKTTQIFNINKPGKSNINCTQLSDMKYARATPGVCKLHNNTQIVVAGGLVFGKGSDKMEIYNLNKNKYTLYSAKFNFEHKFPKIYNDPYNHNIIYIIGDWLNMGGKKQSLGYIEWCDLREKKKKFNMLFEESLDQTFEFVGVRPNLWEVRTMECFTL